MAVKVVDNASTLRKMGECISQRSLPLVLIAGVVARLGRRMHVETSLCCAMQNTFSLLICSRCKTSISQLVSILCCQPAYCQA